MHLSDGIEILFFSQLPVTFYPEDSGIYSQFWDLEVSSYVKTVFY